MPGWFGWSWKQTWRFGTGVQDDEGVRACLSDSWQCHGFHFLLKMLQFLEDGLVGVLFNMNCFCQGGDLLQCLHGLWVFLHLDGRFETASDDLQQLFVTNV